ncbi:MAG: AAA family ATPase [Myxococcaceae bacterium]|nr:AAA family ATPase [Myxococcaceae bacterium]
MLGPFTRFVRSVQLLPGFIPDRTKHPFTVPAIKHLDVLELHPQVTFFVGENGTGKSTLLEAIAVAAGFNPEGGTKNFKFATKHEEYPLRSCLRLSRGTNREATGFFLRAESFFNVASEIDRIGDGILRSYGGKSLHEQSHGESFMALVNHRFGEHGLYLLDEPEAALSPQRQLALLVAIDRLARFEDCQFIIATHSPIVLAYPHAQLYSFSQTAITPVTYEETEHYLLTRDFLMNKDRYLARLLTDPPPADEPKSPRRGKRKAGS